MIDTLPREGWSGFTMIVGGEVVYGTHTDHSTYIPKRHREVDLYTPWGWMGPAEQNHQIVHSALDGTLRMERWDRISTPLITANGALYQIDIQTGTIDVKFLESGIWEDCDHDVMRIWTTDPAISQVIQTIYHLTQSVDSVLDHLARWHGLRKEYIVRRPIQHLCREIIRRGCNRPLETLQYECQKQTYLDGKKG